MLLEGKVRYVVGGLRQMMTKRDLKGTRRKTVREVAGYFERNCARMKYDEYLAAGYPIGSGVAEGACRHLVKDRLERTGMRWHPDGAQAMLNLRATYLNGEWESFWAYFYCILHSRSWYFNRGNRLRARCAYSRACSLRRSQRVLRRQSEDG